MASPRQLTTARSIALRSSRTFPGHWCSRSSAIAGAESAGGVVLNGAGQVLVVNQKGTSWSLPKGHVEEGEDALSAARREIFEEAGIPAGVLNLILGSGSDLT